jgi:biotin carboxyl carrier protein
LKLEIEFGGKARTVEIEADSSRGGPIRCSIDGRIVEADAAEVAPGIYSILIGGTSLEARVEPHGTALRVIVAGREYATTVRDPQQWRRSRGAALQAEGRQQVLAPMPGKIVRVLVKGGDAVEAGQGILVVEAMKMQNEVRAPKSGTVERLLVSENQAVAAGDVLAIVA